VKPGSTVEFHGEPGVQYELLRATRGYAVVKKLGRERRVIVQKTQTVKGPRGGKYKVELEEPIEHEVNVRPRGEMVSSGSLVYVVPRRVDQEPFITVEE
jgi:hypothetical protein